MAPPRPNPFPRPEADSPDRPTKTDSPPEIGLAALAGVFVVVAIWVPDWWRNRLLATAAVLGVVVLILVGVKRRRS